MDTNDNKFNLAYLIVKISLVVFIVIMIILDIVGLFQSHEVGNAIWVVFSLLSLIIGLIGVWKENFLFAIIFTIVCIILASISSLGVIWAGNTVGAVILIFLALFYTILLYFNGHQQLELPSIC